VSAATSRVDKKIAVKIRDRGKVRIAQGDADERVLDKVLGGGGIVADDELPSPAKEAVVVTDENVIQPVIGRPTVQNGHFFGFDL
jgi:hypothetical protein